MTLYKKRYDERTAEKRAAKVIQLLRLPPSTWSEDGELKAVSHVIKSAQADVLDEAHRMLSTNKAHAAGASIVDRLRLRVWGD